VKKQNVEYAQSFLTVLMLFTENYQN